jgi:hypothetical protein
MTVLKAARFLILAGFVCFVAACKLAVIVVEGGEVQSQRSGTCVAGTICIVEVNDTNFRDLFTAVPNEGWNFQKWNSGDRLLCAESTFPGCEVSSEEAAGNSVLEALIASSETFYLMPVFVPAPDIIKADGKEWYQPYLFKDLSWNDINEICQEGGCKGVLNGIDLRGWTWASIDDFNALINFYIGRDELGPGGGDYYWELDSEWFPALFEDGWRSSRAYSNFLGGITRDLFNVEGFYEAYNPYISDSRGSHEVSTRADLNDYEAAGGAWFYRVP